MNIYVQSRRRDKKEKLYVGHQEEAGGWISPTRMAAGALPCVSRGISTINIWIPFPTCAHGHTHMWSSLHACFFSCISFLVFSIFMLNKELGPLLFIGSFWFGFLLGREIGEPKISLIQLYKIELTKGSYKLRSNRWLGLGLAGKIRQI